MKANPRIPRQRAVWTTREGQALLICQMTDDHLRNSLRLVYRNGCKQLDIAIQQGYQMLMGLTGPAVAACCRDIEKLEYMEVEDLINRYHPKWQALVKDAERRGLEWRYADHEEMSFRGQSFLALFPHLAAALKLRKAYPRGSFGREDE